MLFFLNKIIIYLIYIKKKIYNHDDQMYISYFNNSTVTGFHLESRKTSTKIIGYFFSLFDFRNLHAVVTYLY